jgi:hypothetical protein
MPSHEGSTNLIAPRRDSARHTATLIAIVLLCTPCAAGAQATATESRTATGWAWATTRLAADHVEVRGPARRIRGPARRIAATEDQTLCRPDWHLTGAFSVKAVFERPANASSSAAYGLTLGSTSEKAVAFAVLIRPDGSLSVQRGSAIGAGAWQPQPALHGPRSDGATVDRLELRVSGTDVHVLVNGQRIATETIQPGELDGSPGVHISSGGDIVVAGFTVEAAAALLKR